MTMAKQEKETSTVYLLKPHRHAGRDYPVGASLDLHQSKAAWLVGLGVATKTAPAPTTETPKEA
jgi:hypothetical protein